jgi:hypothetical protein
MVPFDIVEPADPTGFSFTQGIFCSITFGGLAFYFPLSLIFASGRNAGIRIVLGYSRRLLDVVDIK